MAEHASPPTGSAVGARWVQRVLRSGLRASVILVTVGLVWALVDGQWTSEPVVIRSLLSDGTRAHRVIAVGLIVLALTPVVGIVALVINWWREGDHRFVATGLAVLVILALAVALGRG